MSEVDGGVFWVSVGLSKINEAVDGVTEEEWPDCVVGAETWEDSVDKRGRGLGDSFVVVVKADPICAVIVVVVGVGGSVVVEEVCSIRVAVVVGVGPIGI